MKRNKGITLVALVITVIILIILSMVTINSLFGNEGIIEKSKYAIYKTEFKKVEEQVELYVLKEQIENMGNYEKDILATIGEKIEKEEIENIIEENKSFVIEVEKLSKKDIEDVELYWIDLDKLNCKANHSYIIDIKTKQIYNYEAEKIYNLNWHTLHGGVEVEKTEEKVEGEDEEEKIQGEKPKEPEFVSNYGYPILRKDGIINNGKTKIIYDETKEYKNYYSLDSGNSWIEYTEEIERITQETIMAKSIDIENGIETISSVEVEIPEDAIGPEGYDKNSDTYYNGGPMDKGYSYMEVDEEAIGLDIIAELAGNYTQIILLDENDNILYETEVAGTEEKKKIEFEILEGTKRIALYCNNNAGDKSWLYEVIIATEPLISAEVYYAEIADIDVKMPYNMITIKYHDSSVQKLYKIDNGEWKAYEGDKIKLEEGQTIYAQGLDKLGVGSSVAQYTSIKPKDAIGKNACDKNSNTYYNAGKDSAGYSYMEVSETAIGKKVAVDIGCKYARVRLLDENKKVLYTSSQPGTSGGRKTFEFEILEGTKYLVLYCSSSNGNGAYLYEVRVVIEPEITVASSYYAKITSTGIEAPYNMINIQYFGKNGQCLYKIGEGEWQTYENKEIKVETGKTIYAKEIISEGIETPATEYISERPSKAIGLEAFDGDNDTSHNAGKKSAGYSYMEVDESMVGKKISVYLGLKYARVRLLNESNTVLYTSGQPGTSGGKKTFTFEILEGTKYLGLYCSDNNGNGARLYEVTIVEE